MTFSVSPNLWGPRVRAQVQNFNKRWPTFSWGTYPGHDPTEALATDGMVPNWDKAGGRDRGRAVAQAIWDDRRHNGIWYVIHWGQIISITRPELGWIPYYAADSPNPSKSHHNHVHVSWHSDGAAPPVHPPAPKPKPQPKPAPKPSGLTPYWLSYLLQARKLDMHAAVTVTTHAETTNTVEKALRTWGYTGHLVVDGHYGTSTETAVEWWQSTFARGGQQGGVFTEWQWKKFAGGPDGKGLFTPELGNYKRWIDQPEPVVEPKPPGLPTLKLSDFNAARDDINRARTHKLHPLTVHRAEWALHDFGYSVGPVDGHYGIATDIAVRKFQADHSPGVDPDGILGPKEWALLAAGPKDGKHPARFIPA